MYLVAVLVSAALGAGEGTMLRFEKERIGTVTYEAASVMDVNQDGVLDIVSGEYWFEGPEFKKQHKICDIRKEADYYDDFSNFPMDVNGDGYMDFITGGWWGNTLRWRENPRDPAKEWPEHVIAETGNVETTRAWDVDGDGVPEIVPNCPGKPLTVYKLVTDGRGKGTGSFVSYTLYGEKQGHGLGFGDITGNGRGDFLGMVNGKSLGDHFPEK